MQLLDSLLGLPRSLPNSTAPLLRQLPSSTDLTLTVRRERARADRSGGGFSLLIFTAPGSSSRRHALEPVADYVAQRVRIIDHYACTADGRLWLILADCPVDASEQLARKICERFSTESQQIACEVCHYTADSRGRQHPGSLSRQEPSARSGCEAPSSVAATDIWPHLSPAVESPLIQATPTWKRCLDVVIATLALVCLSPLLALVALLIKLTSQGPTLFVQLRAGRSGRPFPMYKFRTMAADAEERKSDLLVCNEQDGPAFKMQNDPRVTRIGRLLRATSIDELPQLWNVLRGQMSLVGPRPLPVSESQQCKPWQQERLDVTPGLTCLWQVCDQRSRIPFIEWMRMDIRYSRARSLALDLLLICRTVAFVFRRKGM